MRYRALETPRDRPLVFVLAYAAVWVTELLGEPNDSRRRGARWDEISLDDWSRDGYWKK